MHNKRSILIPHASALPSPRAGSLLTYAASCSPVVAPSTRGVLMARHAKQANATTDVASTSPCAARRMSAARC